MLPMAIMDSESVPSGRNTLVNTEDLVGLAICAVLAAGFGTAAKKYGARLGIPPALIPVIGGLLLTAVKTPR